jgi:heme/copper-type cytochrome/quinol oxidase subunit 2
VLKLRDGTVVRETPGDDVGMKNGDTKNMMKSSPQYAFIVTIMLIIMLVVIAVILVLFVKNKNKEQDMPQADNLS